MIDARLRGPAGAVLDPLARRIPGGVTPTAVTAAAAVPGLAAAVAAGAGLHALAVALWLLNRVLDGLDGALARRRGRATDSGAYADILLDVVVYAAIPIGIAAHQGDRAAWTAAAVLLAAFYVNAVSWAYLSALLERRGAGARARGERTAVTMPAGLVEGAETIVLFTVALAVPGWATAVMWVMAAAVGAGAAARAVGARRALAAG
jgi:phosphatidylglycerophosphate synthase